MIIVKNVVVCYQHFPSWLSIKKKLKSQYFNILIKRSYKRNGVAKNVKKSEFLELYNLPDF